MDQLLSKRFSQDYYVEKIQALLNENTKNPVKARKIITKSFFEGDSSKVMAYLDKVVEKKEVIITIMQIVQAAITILSSIRAI